MYRDEKRLCPGGYSLFDWVKKKNVFLLRSSRHFVTWNVILFLN